MPAELIPYLESMEAAQAALSGSSDLEIGIPRTEMLQHDQRVCLRRVYDQDAPARSVLGHEELVHRELTEADQRGSLDVPRPHPSMPLEQDRAVRSAVPDRDGLAGKHGELLCAVVGGFVRDPALPV